MDSIFGFCCANRDKDDAASSQRSTMDKPIEYIRSKPGLVRVLKWFDEVEEKFRESMIDVGEKIENIISELDGQATEELIEVGPGHEVLAKVVGKEAVAEALAFGSHQSKLMQNVVETIEFFKI